MPSTARESPICKEFFLNITRRKKRIEALIRMKGIKLGSRGSCINTRIFIHFARRVDKAISVCTSGGPVARRGERVSGCVGILIAWRPLWDWRRSRAESVKAVGPRLSTRTRPKTKPYLLRCATCDPGALRLTVLYQRPLASGSQPCFPLGHTRISR